jgi:hypothetical protein
MTARSDSAADVAANSMASLQQKKKNMQKLGDQQ